jgi:hypothetical protein
MRSTRRVRASLALAFVTLAAASPCRADDAGDDTRVSEQATAQALFDTAKELMAAGSFAEACVKFAESERLDPAAGTQLRLGDCYERTGRLASAWVTYREAAATARRTGRTAWALQGTRRADALRARVPMVTIRVNVDPSLEDLVVLRDGQQVTRPTWGTPIPVDPGPHLIEARARARATWSTEIVVTEGAHLELEVGPLREDTTGSPPARGREPAGASPGTSSSAIAPGAVTGTVTGTATRPDEGAVPRRGSTQRAIGLGVGAAGLAAVTTGAIFGLVAILKNDAADRRCPQSGPCADAEAVALTDDARSAATVSTVALLGGGAMLALGTVLFVTAPRATRAATLRPGGMGVAGAGLFVDGAF